MEVLITMCSQDKSPAAARSGDITGSTFTALSFTAIFELSTAGQGFLEEPEKDWDL